MQKCLCAFFFLPFFSFSQAIVDSISKICFATQISGNTGYLYSTPGDTSGNAFFPYSFHAAALWNFNSAKFFNACNCLPETGFSVSFHDFARKETGHALAGSWQTTFTVAQGKFMRLKMGGSFGYAYLSKPFHEKENPLNLAYSLHHGFYESVFMETDFRVARKWVLFIGLAHHHFSNGGSREPNKGADYPSLRAGLRYETNYLQCDFGKRTGFAAGKKLRLDLFTFLTNSAPSHGAKSRYWIGGIYGGSAVRVSGYNGFNAGIELYDDQNPKSKGFGIGLLAGHELLFGHIAFTQQLGYYIRNPLDKSKFYQRYGMNFKIWKNFCAGVNAKFHEQNIDFLDVRIGAVF